VNPTVTLVMAAHNAADTIDAALDSLLQQVYADFEIIVVDDASEDDTRSRVRAKRKLDDRIQLIELPSNVGSGAARNLALKEASGRFIAVADADDISLPARLEQQVNLLQADSTLAVVSGDVSEFGNWGGPIPHSWPAASSEISHALSKGKMPIAHCAMVARRDAMLDYGGYDPYCRRAQDYALMLRMRHLPMANTGEVSVLYRTLRPLPFDYAIRSGRYGALAKRRVLQRDGRSSTAPRSLPASLPIDIRSTLGWLKRRALERNGAFS
jgi:teichuronic acid biosynthesis glycosyltransferase TuaG